VIYGAEPMTPFQAEAGSQTAPDVDFGDMGAAPAQPAPAQAAPANDDAPAAPAAAAN